jgi:hypothetical protein
MLCRRGQHGMREFPYGIIQPSNFFGHPADGRELEPKISIQDQE